MMRWRLRVTLRLNPRCSKMSTVSRRNQKDRDPATSQAHVDGSDLPAPVRRLGRLDIAILISGLLASLTVVRVLSFADFNVQTAYMLLAVSDRSQLLFATAVDSLLVVSWFAMNFAVALIASRFGILPEAPRYVRQTIDWLHASRVPAAWAGRVIVVVLVCIGVWTAPLIMFAPIPLTAATYFVVLMARRLRRVVLKKTTAGSGESRVAPILRALVIWTGSAIFALAGYLHLTTAWVPPEAITLKGEEPRVVHIFGERDGLLFARSFGGTWFSIDPKNIEERNLCVYPKPRLLLRSLSDGDHKTQWLCYSRPS